MPPPAINVFFAERVPPIACSSVAEMDAALDWLHRTSAQRLLAPGDDRCPLSVLISVEGYNIHSGLGVEQSFVTVAVEPFDGETYTAVGDESAKGDSRMFFGAADDVYPEPWSMIPTQTARELIRYLIQHRRRSPAVRWKDYADRDV